MLDKRALSDELTEAFICKEYADACGVMEYDFREKAVDKYRNDPIFHNRVKYATAFVMNIVGKHEK